MNKNRGATVWQTGKFARFARNNILKKSRRTGSLHYIFSRRSIYG
jgi:hypothetical protein